MGCQPPAGAVRRSDQFPPKAASNAIAVSFGSPDVSMMPFSRSIMSFPPGKFRPGFSVPLDAPPAFFVVAHDDGANPTEAAMLYLAYKKLGFSAELHVYAKGGHGFGMLKRGQAIDQWPARVAEWLAGMGVVESAGGPTPVQRGR